MLVELLAFMMSILQFNAAVLQLVFRSSLETLFRGGVKICIHPRFLTADEKRRNGIEMVMYATFKLLPDQVIAVGELPEPFF